MNWQQQTWYKAGGEIVARAGFSLAMCGALAGVLYLTAGGSHDMADASAGKPPQTATVLASFERSPGLSLSQAAVDASPVAMPVAAEAVIPVPTLADIGPVPARRPLSPTRKASKELVALASTVDRFESCLPDCETRDPLIVGSYPKSPASQVSPLPSDELVQDFSRTERNPSLLGRALDAPGAVYRTGRHALTTLVRAAL